MKKIALIFVLAVLGPSLVLAWLAIRSLHDQQFLFQHQQSLLYQQIADAKVKEINSYLADLQRDFKQQVEAITRGNPESVASTFDETLRKAWPQAEIGFAVSPGAEISSPSLFSRPEARQFRLENDRFLCSEETVAVYWNAQQSPSNIFNTFSNVAVKIEATTGDTNITKSAASAKLESRRVTPQQATPIAEQNNQSNEAERTSKVSATAAEFNELVGGATEGTIARFLQNQLKLMFWYRPEDRSARGTNSENNASTAGPHRGHLVFGAQIKLDDLIRHIRDLSKVDATLAQAICLTVLDDKAKPIALSQPNFKTQWKHPFVASEIGETLPHWEVAIYLLDPNKLTRSAIAARTTLGLMISLLVLAISTGGWLIVHCLKQELQLARQKTDFVSNVSHELKTPLTSIRMFSELLAEGRVHDPAKRRSYFNIITAETARLTRLINNVLDFSRMDRGEKKYNFDDCDVVSVARETAQNYQPHLEAHGFKFETQLPSQPVFVRGDKDALSQILVNLISNAEKYSNGAKEITLELPEPANSTLEVRVLDRGSGVPAGSEEKIFEQFFRAHDSLSSGVQGSGLGLTLARQIARAHGGDVTYKPRAGGGSCFTLRLPQKEKDSNSRKDENQNSRR